MGLGRFITHTMFGVAQPTTAPYPYPRRGSSEPPTGKVYLTYQEAQKSKVDVGGGPPEFPDPVEPQILLGS